MIPARIRRIPTARLKPDEGHSNIVLASPIPASGRRLTAATRDSIGFSLSSAVRRAEAKAARISADSRSLTSPAMCRANRCSSSEPLPSNHSFLPDHSFDIVITNNVIQDIKDYQGAIQEFSRLLRPAGTYLQIINHPCFGAPGCGWEKDSSGSRLHWKVDHYFNRGPFPIKWRPETGLEPTISWHRTLGDLVNSLISCGFRITQLIEPEPPESWINLHPEMYKSDSRKPDFLVVVCSQET